MSTPPKSLGVVRCVDADDNGHLDALPPLPRHQALIQSQLAAQRARPQPDADVLAKAVGDAGLNAFGCILVEMWVLSEDGTELFRPEGGHWMNPAFASSLPNEELIEQAWELDRHAEPPPPGAGLAVRN